MPEHGAFYPSDVYVHEARDVGVRQAVESAQQEYLPGPARQFAQLLAELDGFRRGLRSRQPGGQVQ
ncbi:hypothetical protein PSA5_15225 [Pseudomonas syringae pv. actinidiae]|nr:hypothetical protein PSA5_15225 [Pseudomonas syringae pv. actinidiae]